MHLTVTPAKPAGIESASPVAPDSPAATSAPVNWQFGGVPGGVSLSPLSMHERDSLLCIPALPFDASQL